MRMGDALRRMADAADATGGAVKSGARAGASASRKTGGFVHRLTGASGAGRTGLGTLIELTSASGAADMFVTVALAGTIFFSASVDQARGTVVLFLIVTMAPFAILAPFIGPALDRMQQGRKYVLAGTLMARGLLAWGMSAAIGNTVTLLPAAFGILVLQKAYGVVKASITPRLLPPEIPLVTANSRSGLMALAGSTVAAGVAAGVQELLGPAWVLRFGTVVYLAAMLIALRLPDQIDSPRVASATKPAPASGTPGNGAAAPGTGATTPMPGNGQQGRTRPYEPVAALPTGSTGPSGDGGHGSRAGPSGPSDNGAGGQDPGAAGHSSGAPGHGSGAPGHGSGNGRRWRTLTRVGPVVAEAMTVNAVLRAFSGYVLFLLAFLLRSIHFGDPHHYVSSNFALGALAFGLSAGSLLAMALGSMLKSRAPQLMMFGVLAAAPGGAAARAWFFGLWAAVAVGFAAIFCASLAKLAQDSIVQREIGEEIRSSAFSVSETLNQVANVAGGLAGVLVSMLNNGQAGLSIAAAGLFVALILIVSHRRRRVVLTNTRHALAMALPHPGGASAPAGGD
jgi:MFS family permease